MTIEEAFLKSKTEGVKIAHRYFSPDEYIIVKGNQVETEEGYTCWVDDFLVGRRQPAWQTDWEIYKEPNQP